MSQLASLDTVEADTDLVPEVAHALLLPRRLLAFEAEALGFVQRRTGASALLLVMSEGQRRHTLGAGMPLALALLRGVAKNPSSARLRRRARALTTTGGRVLFVADDDRAAARVAQVAELVTRAASLAIDCERLYRSSVTDPLTGLYNRRFLSEMVTRELAGACRHRRPLAVLALDLDGFKQVNDRLGHAAGDRLLSAVAAVLARVTRKSDIAARTGGDEFVLLMPGASRARAVTAARRIAEAVSALADSENLGRFSVSIGIAQADGADPDLGFDELMSRADRAMYKCKREGK